ncbi:Target of rapamycin complex 2 subunit avo2 [Desmophyllum pertusum]|uniref:Target of rapamycin complex 2 subunit avo2 n=1 Tax=Desmophyllum pertusum TaxID=174260 RepID=A0A9W9ZXA6_9CNID|nr:Target of rapamycin complex 2 subunit avo2 [Desmophyllum pertusum]
MAAAENGHVSCVEQICLSEPGHINDKDERGLTPLHLAARASHQGNMHTTFAHGCEPHDSRHQPLDSAAPLRSWRMRENPLKHCSRITPRVP